MPVSLTKGGNVSLTKEAPGLTAITVGLGWKPRVTDGSAFDLDALVFALGADGKVIDDAAFVFFNNPIGFGGAIEHGGDNRTGAGEGDDEKIKIDLSKLPDAVTKIIVAVTIHEAESRKQNFGQVGDAYMRVLNAVGDAEIARFDLSEDGAVESAMIFGEIYRNNGEWKFKAVSQGFAGGLGPLAASYGVNV